MGSHQVSHFLSYAEVQAINKGGVVGKVLYGWIIDYSLQRQSVLLSDIFKEVTRSTDFGRKLCSQSGC